MQLEWHLTPQDADEVIITFSWAVVRADGTVQFASNHSWDPALYGPVLPLFPDLRCSLMESICIQVNSLGKPDSKVARQTGHQAPLHPNLRDKALLFSHFSRIHWDHGRLEHCDADWMLAHHPEALTPRHKEFLDRVSAQEKQAAAWGAKPRKRSKTDKAPAPCQGEP
ncbi:hypothetical protein WJX73_000961 [Symbiochloris irregularis]|uniref:Uncharacterized protein n=1 Tax=Symbiochloris irregularis TaxID=706552 RepID=A0AAW1PLG9_9CHLO